MESSSPTTTRAVNEKRRPPLTTLATRLISTTRSWRSRPAGVMFLLWGMSLCRVAAAPLSVGPAGPPGGVCGGPDAGLGVGAGAGGKPAHAAVGACALRRLL